MVVVRPMHGHNAAFIESHWREALEDSAPRRFFVKIAVSYTR